MTSVAGLRPQDLLLVPAAFVVPAHVAAPIALLILGRRVARSPFWRAAG